MAGCAGLALEQRFAILGQGRLEGERAAQGEHREQNFLHENFLKARVGRAAARPGLAQ
jgi:hypothetical protein